MMIDGFREQYTQVKLFNAFEMYPSILQPESAYRYAYMNEEKVQRKVEIIYYDNRGEAGSSTISAMFKHQALRISRYRERTLMKSWA